MVKAKGYYVQLINSNSIIFNFVWFQFSVWMLQYAKKSIAIWIWTLIFWNMPHRALWELDNGDFLGYLNAFFDTYRRIISIILLHNNQNVKMTVLFQPRIFNFQFVNLNSNSNNLTIVNSFREYCYTISLICSALLYHRKFL